MHYLCLFVLSCARFCGVGFDSKAFLCSLVVALTAPLCAQSLAPRAYVITPEHWNAVTVTWSLYDGGFNVNGALPITGATGVFQTFRFSASTIPSAFSDAALTSPRYCHTVSVTFKGRSWAWKDQSTAPGFLISPLASPLT